MKIEIDLNVNLNLGSELTQILQQGVSAFCLLAASEAVNNGAAPAPVTAPEPAKPAAAKAGSKAKDKTVAPPADPKPEAQAQDVADEAAETKANDAAKAAEVVDAGKPAEAAIDANSLRAAGKAYADKYGMPACLEDAPKIIGFPSFGKVPADKVVEAYNAVVAATEQNPFDRAEKTA